MKRIAMMLLVTTISAAGILPFARAACAQVTDHSAKTDDPAEQEIRKLNAQEVEAFLQNDPKSMARLWSEDLVVTNPLNKFVTKQQVLGMVASGFLVITSYDRQIEYLRFYGDTAIVAGNETVRWGGRMPNAGKTEHLRFTAVWMKQAGRGNKWPGTPTLCLSNSDSVSRRRQEAGSRHIAIARQALAQLLSLAEILERNPRGAQ